MIDLILHDFLDEKIGEIKSDPAILEFIFEEYPLDTIESIKQFLLTNKVRTVYHFPRDASELPCYAIILESSAESDQVIGMSGDIYDEVLISSMEDGWIGSDSDIFRAGVHWESGISGFSGYSPQGKLVPDEQPSVFSPTDVFQYYNALEVKDGRRSCHFIGKKGTSALKGIWIDYKNSVLGYKSLVGCKYVTFWIKSNRVGDFIKFGFGETSHEEYAFRFPVTVRNLWEKIRIDISSVPQRNRDHIRYMSFRLMDDSAYTDVFIDKLMGEGETQYVRREAYFDHNYRIEAWTNNAELTLYLFQIAKWNLIRHRDYLESSWGLYRQRLTGGDIMPQPEYYPEFVYIRALNYNCTTVEAIPTEERFAFDIKVGRMDFGQGYGGGGLSGQTA